MDVWGKPRQAVCLSCAKPAEPCPAPDPDSLALITRLLAPGVSPYLQVVGAYRESEVGPGHPLALALEDLAREGPRIRTIRLDPLPERYVAQFCAETFQAAPDEVFPLARLLHRKSAGNPYFICRLLRSLHGEGLVRYDVGTGRWLWDLRAIKRGAVPDDVVELLLRVFDQLPAASREILKLAACLGNVVDLGILATSTDRSRAAAARDLWPAVEGDCSIRSGTLTGCRCGKGPWTIAWRRTKRPSSSPMTGCNRPPRRCWGKKRAVLSTCGPGACSERPTGRKTASSKPWII